MAKTIGRPPKTTAKRTQSITIYLTEGEKRRLTKAAWIRQRTITSWCRAVALVTADDVIRELKETDPDE